MDSSFRQRKTKLHKLTLSTLHFHFTAAQIVINCTLKCAMQTNSAGSVRGLGDLKFCEKFLRFLEKRRLTVKFSKFCSESFHRLTDRRVVLKFREIWPTEIGEIVRCLPHKNKFRLPLKLSLLRRSRSKSARANQPTMYSECSRFHTNRLTFGGVIAERVNTAIMRRKVNPIFGWSLASPRIIMDKIVLCTC